MNEGDSRDAFTPTTEARDWQKHSAIASYLLVAVGCLGLILVVCEFQQLRQQSKVLERSLKQSYRPVGEIYLPETVTLEYIACKSPNCFSFQHRINLKNRGPGVLSYLGHLSYLSSKQLDFRGALMARQLSDISHDHTYSHIRSTTLVPGDSLGFYVTMEEIEPEPEYYLYALVLYEDQDTNLYDTELVEVFRFGEPTLTDSGLQPNLLKTAPPPRQTFHAYSGAERRNLGDLLSSIDNPLAPFLMQIGERDHFAPPDSSDVNAPEDMEY